MGDTESVTQEDSPGQYVIVGDYGAVVREQASLDSESIAKLSKGTVVNVVEVVVEPDEYRICGKIQGSGGWISLKQSGDGRRWACKKDTQASNAETSHCASSSESCDNSVIAFTQEPDSDD